MNKGLKNQAFLLLSAALLSCSSDGKLSGQATDTVPVIVSSPFSFNVGKSKGATITVKINFSQENNYKVKASSSGSAATAISDIKSYKVYLLKNAAPAGFPGTVDPLAPASITGGPYTINKTNVTSDTISLLNVPGSSGAYYYIGVKAFSGIDAGGTELFKPNGSLLGSPRMVVSTNPGISVDNTTLVASSTAALTLNANLLDALGARLENIITVNSGSGTIPPLSTSFIPVLTSTIAGDGTFGDTTSPNPTVAQLKSPGGVAVDIAGNIYIADTTHNVIRKITITTNTLSTIAGVFNSTGVNETTTALTCKLNAPQGVAVDGSGSNIYIADTGNHRIRKVTGTTISTIAGTGTGGNTVSTDPLLADFNNPKGIALDSSGNIYIADTIHNVIRKITIATNTLSTIAGVFNSSGANETTNALTCNLKAPQGVAVDSRSNVYVADTNSNVIRKVTPGGHIFRFAGTADTLPGITDTGVATTSSLNAPNGLAIDSLDNVFIANTSDHTVRKVTKSGAITTVVGTGIAGNASTSGSITITSTTPLLSSPQGVAVDSSGNVYIANTGNNTIRKVF